MSTNRKAGTGDTELQTGPLCVIDSDVFAIGDVIAVDGRVSWFPSDARGYAPVNAYLLRDHGRSLLIDTGVPVHELAVLAQLDTLLDDGDDLVLLLTRTVEFDSASNADAIIDRFHITEVHSHFVPQEWLHFQPDRDPETPVPVATWFHPIAQAERETFFARDATIEGKRLRPGTAVPRSGAGPNGGDVLVSEAPLRLLQTAWFFDERTGTLFTSDSFGHVLMASRDSPRVVTSTDDTTSYETVRSHLGGKFEWLRRADVKELSRQVEAIFEQHEIHVIAPGYGCILKGREVVERHYEMLSRALRELA